MASNDATGLLAVGACVILFGVFPLTTKQYKTGDGVFFQFLMCVGIFFIGTIVYFIQCQYTSQNEALTLPPYEHIHTCPQFIPVSALGGVIWCISNFLLVPLVKCIGIGLCMMIWGMAETLIGWSTGRFGLFGLNKETVSSDILNSCGVGLALLSLLVLASANSSVSDGSDKDIKDDRGGSTDEKRKLLLNAVIVAHVGEREESLSIAATSVSMEGEEEEKGRGRGGLERAHIKVHDSDEDDDDDEEEKKKRHFLEHGYDFTLYLTPTQKRIFGTLGSLFAGLLSGSTFSPPQYVVDTNTKWINEHNRNTSSSSSLFASEIDTDTTVNDNTANAPFPGGSIFLFDHIFSHFTGIILTSTVFTILYCIVTRNKPWVSAELLFPSFISGLIWGIACVSWFIANQHLSIVIAFPLVTLGPGLVNMIIGTVVYKEIQGCRNLSLLAIATCMYLSASVMIASSGGAS